MRIEWVRIKDALHNLDEHSGASMDYARGVVVGILSFFVALGWERRSIWEKIIPLVPDSFKVPMFPAVWCNGDITEWSIDWKQVTPFKKLIEYIPKEMLEMKTEDNGWTCRDHLLGRYLYVCSIFQREKDMEIQKWRLAIETLPTEKSESPKLVFTLDPFVKQGSQYIANWAVSDLSREVKNSFNFHGQNTSRWLYAGCILVQDGRVSIHT